MWRWRRLVWELARRDFKARYAGSVLGGAWAVLEPLVQFALYLTVFSYFLGMRLEGKPGVGLFGVYLISGLVPFLAFQESVMRATGLARERAQLVRHVNVPLEVVLAGALTAVLARHGVALLLVVGAAIGFGTFAPAGLPWLLAGLAVLVIGVFGLGLVLMIGGAFLPDLVQLVGTATMILFFATPIVYPVTAIPHRVASWMAFNPIWGGLHCFRVALLGEPPEAGAFFLAAVSALVALAIGVVVFKLRRHEVPDLL
ncbi:MAG TPA: ABC transporter permease [Thermoanaerobaculaceae bacterium]|nr:ABC transporter permease [Thermoanaerobaculaceae bacterium]